MAEGPVAVIVGGFLALMFILAMIPVFTSLSKIATDSQCAPYITQVGQKDSEISGLKQQNSQLDQNVQQCRAEYTRLITENVTKKDIEDLKQEINISRYDVAILNQKFDTVNNNYVAIYNKLYFNYQVVFIVNIFLIFIIIGDLISASVFNFDIKKNVIDWIVKKLKRKKKEEHHESKQ